MSEQKNTHKKGSWTVRSIYIALAVCLAAVAVAAWTTFQSISSTLQGTVNDAPQTEQAELTEEVLSGVVEEQEEEPEVSIEEAEETDLTPTVFTLPLQNGVQKSFSGESLVYSETLRDWRVHTGTDYQAEEGEIVCAIADGAVTKVYDDGLMGHVVVIQSGSLEVLYCGLDEIMAAEGDSITAGQEIGTVGLIPAEQSDAPHLHLEVKQNGVFVDAEKLIS